MKANEISKDVENYIVECRRHLHKYPETAFNEHETCKFIESKLDELHIPHKRLIDTGIVAMIGEESDNCVALRADIDGLPISENTGLPFSSLNEGRMHACGHDFHTSMLLGAAKILKAKEAELNGCVKLIFQPAEEMIPGGAFLMIEAGVMDNPKPKAIFGQHINPATPTGKLEFAYGPMMASSDELYWTIKGKSSHAATPHLGSDPILAASNMILALQNIITKFKNPLDPGVISITSIHSGSATNILPDEAKLMGTFRAYDNKWRYDTIEVIREISKSIVSAYGCESVFEPKMGFPPVINDNNAGDIAKLSAIEAVGENNFNLCSPIMWAEDFAYYGDKAPACFWFLGVKNIDDMPPLHNAKLSPDENALNIGAVMLVNCALNTLLGK
jgi:amidohydrolase